MGQNTNTKTTNKQVRRECWESENKITLLDTMKSAMKKVIEDEYKNHDFIQTYGCAYEEDDIEQNSLKAVYRAIVQSLMNRKISFRDDVLTLLKLRALIICKVVKLSTNSLPPPYQRF